jgi:hypothetical protein
MSHRPTTGNNPIYETPRKPNGHTETPSRLTVALWTVSDIIRRLWTVLIAGTAATSIGRERQPSGGSLNFVTMSKTLFATSVGSTFCEAEGDPQNVQSNRTHSQCRSGSRRPFAPPHSPLFSLSVNVGCVGESAASSMAINV